MGLLDSLAKQAIGSLLGGQQGQASDLLSGLLSQTGGLSGLMDKFNNAGLKDTFSSWVSTGENQAVAPEQVQNALGSDVVSGLASKLGLDVGKLLPMISQFLPEVVNKLTPNGAIENNQPNGDQLQDVLAGVLKGGGLSSLFGGGSDNGQTA
jgi:uncharacterized protein YidB (DUF937 family)